MNTIARTAFLSFLPILIYSQVQIAGVINQYTRVNAIEPCESKLTVTDPLAFLAGSKVLLIQMKGASISTSNSSSFGNIEYLGGAGFYEINEVLNVAGNDVYLKYELLHAYSLNGLQLVTIPNFENTTVANTLTAQPWNGETGGVLIFKAENLSLEANIDVSGLGFRGAQKQLVASDCNFLTNADDFHYTTSNWRGSPKGEGIAELVQGKEHGRGAQANGGGGGNDHNSGGGGGANITNGGIGGKQGTSGFGCDGDYPGRGGKACPDDQGRVYLGGGGGAGHFDDDGAGSSGGNGGGIAFILADVIQGNGFSVIANGEKPVNANGDGAGGGGAGGTIIIKTNTLNSAIDIIAKGGDGGDVNNTADRCNGAGGGGSGGRFVSNLSGQVTVNLEGGIAGVNTVPSGQCNGPSNGAESGETGVVENIILIATAQNEIKPVEVLQQPTEALGCLGVQLDLNFQVEGNYLEYQWQVNTGNGWENVPSSNLYIGSKTASLTINSPAPVMDGFFYRCLVSSPCISELYSDEVELQLVNPSQSDFQVTPIGNGSYQFQNNSQNATAYLWDFGDGTTSDEENPTHSYADFGNYMVTLTAFGPCGEDEFTYNLTVAVAPTAAFSFQNSGVCAPQTVQFENQSSSNATSFVWHFPGGIPASSTAASPTVNYSNAGLYDVTLIASNAVGNDTFTLTQAIEVGGTPVVDFGVGVSNLTVTFVNLSLNASLGYLWNFGDGTTSNEANPVHTFPAQSNYQVTLTAYNACGEATLTLSIPTGALPLAQFSANAKSGCDPLVVQFENQSSGSNLTGYFWEFPGGLPPTSTEEHPTVNYNQPGLYAVKLTATNALGNHAVEQANYIQVFPTPIADFTYQLDGYTVNFSNATTGGGNFTWDFGDGTTSQAENPSHQFNGPGNYDVMLTASNMNCGSAISYSVFLMPLATGESELSKHSFVVYPNPVHDILSLVFHEKDNMVGRIRLQNASGQVLQSFDFQGNNLTLNMDGYSNGIYLIEVSTGEATLTRQVVKL
jgi:PKD repeat protein